MDQRTGPIHLTASCSSPYNKSVELERQIRLPAEFRMRFIVGRVVVLVPAFLAVVGLVGIVRPSILAPMIGVKLLLLLFVWWLASRSASKHEMFIETLGVGVRLYGIPDGVASHLVPLAGAGLIVGLFQSATRRDWRWLVVVAVICGLIGAGLLIRWIIYDRWLQAWLTSELAT